jgi:hypothetical protein
MAAESTVKGLVLRDVIVDLFGNFLPGALFIGVASAILAWPFLSFVQVARITVPDVAALEIGVVSSFLALGQHFGVSISLLTGIASYVVGHLFYRQDIKVPDKRSFERIHSSLGNEPWVARDESECEFPYLNLKNYLNARGLHHLAEMVPWTPPDAQIAKKVVPLRSRIVHLAGTFKRYLERGIENLRWQFERDPKTVTVVPDETRTEAKKVQRTKTFINALKLRILNRGPESFGPIARNEAHVRLNSSTWYMARTIMWLSLIATAISVLLANHLWRFQDQAGATQRLVWLPIALPVTGITLSIWTKRKIENVLHYQRVREVIHVLETAHLLFRSDSSSVADLCFGASSWPDRPEMASATETSPAHSNSQHNAQERPSSHEAVHDLVAANVFIDHAPVTPGHDREPLAGTGQESRRPSLD